MKCIFSIFPGTGLSNPNGNILSTLLLKTYTLYFFSFMTRALVVTKLNLYSMHLAALRKRMMKNVKNNQTKLLTRNVLRIVPVLCVKLFALLIFFKVHKSWKLNYLSFFFIFISFLNEMTFSLFTIR